MLLNEIKPSPHLTDYIRLYRIIDFHFTGSAVIPSKIYSPRPEQCLQFYPKDSETVKCQDSKVILSNKRVSCTGQHTKSIQRNVGKDFLSIQVLFQPGAFYRTTGVAMHEMSNLYLDAEDIFGSCVREVNDKLFTAKSYPEMIQVVETFLSNLVRKIKAKEHPIDITGRMMFQQNEQYSLDSFLKASCLCHRQFDRVFKERVGIPPKQFLQIIRFDRAFRMKNRYPDKDWLSIAIHCGYYDYQHMVRDYKEFTGYTPPQFFSIDNGSPERAFGYSET
jgi:AraC-like DNA-binding protein